MSLPTARSVLEAEARAVEALASRLDARFDEAVEILLACRGRVVLTGMGKSGLVARKVAATLSSTGTPALYLHPAEALHGDAGMVAGGDAVVALSASGETREILELLGVLKRLGVKLVSITRPDSSLARASDAALDAAVEREASPLSLVPMASTAAAMAMGDALAVAVFERRGFDEDEFAKYHPGGQIGKRLMKVADLMHTGAALPVVRPDDTLKESLSVMSEKGFGALLVADKAGKKLAGIFTDGDLRRFLQRKGDADAPMARAMIRNPKTVRSTDHAGAALKLMEEKKITALPVVDEHGKLEGILHLHDLWRTQLF